MFFTKVKGILGMNARNLLYVARYNTKANKRFADDKVYTKNFLSSRGLGAARIYTVVKSHKELRRFQPASLPSSFVIKPNHGFGGEGIVVVHKKENGFFVGMRGKKWTWKDLYRTMAAILDGQYAISGLKDEVVIEERLEPHVFFRPFCAEGLPDVRVIVFNLVPVVAMLRLPTPESEGKANLHLGAIGLGIDLGSGRTTHGVQRGKFITRFPSGERVDSMELPLWDETLLAAARCQKMSGIGYLAADLAITTKGVKVLELNARAGLSVQIANRVLLRSRLEKVADVKVLTPEKGVEVARTLFALKPTRKGGKKDEPRVIGAFEQVRLIEAGPETLVAKIDPHAEITLLDERVTIGADARVLTCLIREEKVVLPFRNATLPHDQYQIVIAGKYLKDFLIDASQTKAPSVSSVSGRERDEKILANIDKKLFEISSSIHFLSRIKPQNLKEAKQLFFESPLYAPQFSYAPLDLDTESIRKELKKLPFDFTHPLRALYVEKVKELETRMAFLEHRGDSALEQYSIALYGDVTQAEYEAARAFALHKPVQDDSSEVWRVKRVQRALQEYLAQKRLSGWKVEVKDNAMADMQVVKSGTILLHKRARITANRFQSLLAHEIETHIFREENGRLQPYRIFEQGTAAYLETEEGLAIFNQDKLDIPLGEKRLWAAWRAVAIWYGRGMGFAELFHHLKNEYGVSDESAWHTCVKVKRGLGDTSVHAVFTKDRVYFSGWNKIQEFYRIHGFEGIRKLYRGKIKIEDLPVFDAMYGSEWRLRYVPAWAGESSV